MTLTGLIMDFLQCSAATEAASAELSVAEVAEIADVTPETDLTCSDATYTLQPPSAAPSPNCAPATKQPSHPAQTCRAPRAVHGPKVAKVFHCEVTSPSGRRCKLAKV